LLVDEFLRSCLVFAFRWTYVLASGSGRLNTRVRTPNPFERRVTPYLIPSWQCRERKSSDQLIIDRGLCGHLTGTLVIRLSWPPDFRFSLVLVGHWCKADNNAFYKSLCQIMLVRKWRSFRTLKTIELWILEFILGNNINTKICWTNLKDCSEIFSC